MEVLRTTGNRGLDEEINRILERLKKAEAVPVPKVTDPVRVPISPVPGSVPTAIDVSLDDGTEPFTTSWIEFSATDGFAVSLDGDAVKVNNTGMGVTVESEGGTEFGPERVLNFIAGTHMDPAGVAITGSDIDITINAKAQITPAGLLIALCEAFTPAGTGADTCEVIVPYSSVDGTTSITWNVRRIDFRVNTAGGSPAITVEKSTASGAFSAATVGTVTLGGGTYEGSVTSSLGTVASGNKLRLNVGTLGTATGWTITVLMGA